MKLRISSLFFALFCAICLNPQNSEASTSPGAVIITKIDVQTAAGGQVIFYVSGSRSGMPSCATAGNRWAFSGNNGAGQVTMSIILIAYSSGKPLTIIGTGACDVWGDTETVSYISY